MTSVDFHILRHPVYARACPAYVDDGVCKFFEVIGYAGHIGRGRYNGFILGSSPYVSFIDDDDEVDLSHMADIVALLEADPTIDAVCTDELQLVDGEIRKHNKFIQTGHKLSLRQLRHVHHLVVVRRSSLAPFLYKLLQWPIWSEFALWITMHKAGCNFVWYNEPCYMWKCHEQGAKSMGIKPTDEVRALVKEMFK